MCAYQSLLWILFLSECLVGARSYGLTLGSARIRFP